MRDFIFEVKDVSFAYDPGHLVFHDVTFSVRNGEVLTILGPNGAGKSTLLNCISTLQRPRSGSVYMDGKDCFACSRKELARKISFVPQMQGRTYDFAVREYVAMGRSPHLSLWQSPSERDYALVDQVLEEMDITFLADKAYTRISGGESQQATIARAIVQQSDVIILDEPTNHLDYGNQLKILKILKELASRGYGIIWTTHMPDHALMIGGRSAVLHHDGTLELGNADEIITPERMSALYGAELCRAYVESAGREACVPKKI